MGDHTTREDNEKVKIADKNNDKNKTLLSLEKTLSHVCGKEVVLNSFLLLRDSSKMGERKKPESKWVKKEMIAKNILRLNWHWDRQRQSDNFKLPDRKSYLEWMVSKILKESMLF